MYGTPFRTNAPPPEEPRKPRKSTFAERQANRWLVFIAVLYPSGFFVTLLHRYGLMRSS